MKNIIFTFCFFLICGLSQAQLKVVTNGDVGLGTSTPATQLEVAGSLRISDVDAGQRILNITTVGKGTGAVSRNESDLNWDAKYEFWENGTEYWEFGMKGNSPGNPFRIGPDISGGTSLEILSNGNVGINRLTPTNRLEVGGNALKTSGGSSWSVPSDKRLKNNIRDFNDGLDQVLQMNPVRYTYNELVTDETDREEIGIIAQDMQKIAPYMIEDFVVNTHEFPEDEDLGDKITSSKTYLGYNSNALQYMLVNAIQEQQEMIENLQDQISELHNIIKNQNNTQSGVVIEGENNSALSQNIPNPTNGVTQIDYKVAETANNARMQFFDMSGKLIKEINLDGKAGTVDVELKNMASGTYSYSLIVDGEMVSTKKMVVTQ